MRETQPSAELVGLHQQVRLLHRHRLVDGLPEGGDGDGDVVLVHLLLGEGVLFDVPALDLRPRKAPESRV